MSSPTGTVARVTMISEKRLVSSVCDKPGRECEQRLAGSRLADQRDEVAFGIHQQVQREALLAIARSHAPDRVLRVRVVAQHAQHRGLAADLAHLRIKRWRAVFQIHELIDQQARSTIGPLIR